MGGWKGRLGVGHMMESCMGTCNVVDPYVLNLEEGEVCVPDWVEVVVHLGCTDGTGYDSL